MFPAQNAHGEASPQPVAGSVNDYRASGLRIEQRMPLNHVVGSGEFDVNGSAQRVTYMVYIRYATTRGYHLEPTCLNPSSACVRTTMFIPFLYFTSFSSFSSR